MTPPKLLSGRLTKDRFGASMPVDAPYYQEPPFYYQDVRNFSVGYETDAEAVAELLPEGVEVALPAQIVTSVIWYPSSTFGPYHEAILLVPCLFEAKEYTYIPHIVVDAVPPLAGGREIWGYPKKMATITLDSEDELLCGTVERPQGLRILTATMRRERPGAEQPALPSLSLRVIPSPEPDAPPSLADLVAVNIENRTVHEIWSGPATLSYDGKSPLDPWHTLPVRKVLGGTFSRYDFTLPHGRIVHKY
jgi:acetoacetate decarboxylase